MFSIWHNDNFSERQKNIKMENHATSSTSEMWYSCARWFFDAYRWMNKITNLRLVHWNKKGLNKYKLYVSTIWAKNQIFNNRAVGKCRISHLDRTKKKKNSFVRVLCFVFIVQYVC